MTLRAPIARVLWHFLAAVSLPADCLAGGTARATTSAIEAPAWLYPTAPGTPPGERTADDAAVVVRLPGSAQHYTKGELADLYVTADWIPGSHSPMPRIVAIGRPPQVYACGHCHTPGGQGRPENASLAGLPAAYIVAQVADFASGARHGASGRPFAPSELMRQLARHASAAEVRSAARYFSRQRFMSHVEIVEAERVPRARVVGLVYAALPGAGDEPLGERLLEFAPDPQRHESRDETLRYRAYVPPGSIERGRARALAGATRGAPAPQVACASCHGAQLEGVGLVPRLAGRSPSYLLRQLLAFRSGARAGPAGEPMRAVVSDLALGDMIDVVACAASLTPR
jgi:cytochrome c553